MSEPVDPRTTPVSEYPIEDANREKLSEEEVYERLDSVESGDLIEVVFWQRSTMKARMFVIETREDDVVVQSKHGECRLPKAETFNGSIVGPPSVHRDGDKLGLIEYVLRDDEMPEKREPSEASAGYNL